MPVRAIIFDLFDTLVDLVAPRLEPSAREAQRASAGAAPGGAARRFHPTATRLHQALAARAPVPLERFLEALHEVDHALMVPRYREGRELPTLERFASVAERLDLADPGLPELLTRVHMETLTEHVRAPSHHARALARLGQRAALGLCSNFTHAETAHRVLREAGLRPHLDAVVISEEVGIRKPRSEIFQAALDALGVEAGQALHVGDNLNADVAGASGAGLRTVWLTRRVREPRAALEAYAGPAPDWIIADLAELESLLGSA